MSKNFIGDKVAFWLDGERMVGTVHSAKRGMFGRVKYIVAITVKAGFDPDGIGKEKYRYLTIPEDDMLETIEVKS